MKCPKCKRKNDQNKDGLTQASTPAVTSTPLLGIGSTYERTSSDGAIMMYIPAGGFKMGSENGDGDEQPVHTVYLDAFWIDQTEVTNSMYMTCMDADGCKGPGGSKRLSVLEYPNHPASVNWDMAVTYCLWADARLPTEAE